MTTAETTSPVPASVGPRLDADVDCVRFGMALVCGRNLRLETPNCRINRGLCFLIRSQLHENQDLRNSSHPVEQLIRTIRGQRVILDADLAKIYGVLTWRLNEQVKRNKERFPADFVFTLTMEETGAMTSQFARPKNGRVSRR